MIQNDTEYNEIYLTIPIEYVELYKELMIELLKKGNNILNCCDCNCKSKSTRIIFDCWCAFQSAIAAKKLGQDKNAEVIIKFIKSQLELVKKCNIKDDCNCIIEDIGLDGVLKVIPDCDDCGIPEFFVNPLDGHLYSFYDGEEKRNFDIIDDKFTEI